MHVRMTLLQSAVAVLKHAEKVCRRHPAIMPTGYAGLAFWSLPNEPGSTYQFLAVLFVITLVGPSMSIF